MNKMTNRETTNLEAALRRHAGCRGLLLRKCRSRDPQHPAFGTYCLTDLANNSVLSDASTGYGSSLAQVEAYLSVYMQRDLLARGWTPTMIARWLGKPDRVVAHQGNGYRYEYARMRVHVAEADPKWKKTSDNWKRRNTKAVPTRVDLLAAIFAVNRSAKRYRDAAQACYNAARHGLAGSNRRLKEQLYDLKDRGIAAAYLLGRIAATRRIGALVEYRGEGYCFHSALLPVGVSLEVSEGTQIFVEAKPRRSDEIRQCDAKHTLSVLPKPSGQFIRLTDAGFAPKQKDFSTASRTVGREVE